MMNSLRQSVALVLIAALAACAGTPSDPRDPVVDAAGTATGGVDKPQMPEPIEEHAPRARGVESTQNLSRQALALQQAKQWPEAIAHWQQYLGQVTTESDNTWAWLNVVKCLREDKQWQAANAAMTQLLDHAPDRAQVWHEYAYLSRLQGQFSEAEAAYKQAIALNGNYALAQLNLGILYDLYLFQPQQAADQYRRYLSIQPDDAEVQAWLYALQLRLGDEK